MASMASMYAGKQTGSGQAIPIIQAGPNAGAVNLNALMNMMVSRDVWHYWDTLKIAPSTSYASSYALFNYINGQVDPYAITANQVKTFVETNMPSPASSGFSSPRDLIVDQLGAYFLPGGCGLSGSSTGTFANVADMISFCQYSYFQFRIIDKVFIEGIFEMIPSGIGFTGVSSTTPSVFTLGLVNPHAVNQLGAAFAKYLAPALQWSFTIYFPPQSGPAGVALSSLSTAAGGNGLWLKIFLKGLTDRAVQ
jgi:hypothetical protein